MREKHHWEKRIVQLGGANYKRSQPPGADDGVSLPVRCCLRPRALE